MVGDTGRALCSLEKEGGAFNAVAAHPREDVVAAAVEDSVFFYSIQGCGPAGADTVRPRRRRRAGARAQKWMQRGALRGGSHAQRYTALPPRCAAVCPPP